MTSIGWLQQNLQAVVDGFIAHPETAQPEVITTQEGEPAAVLLPVPLLSALLRAEAIDNAYIAALAGMRTVEAGDEGVGLEQLTLLVAAHDPENGQELLRDFGHADGDQPD